jgi:hypothetical protein
MLRHVLGLDVYSHPRVLDFARKNAFEPVADVMCVSDTHPARHNQVKFHECNLACAPSAEIMGIYRPIGLGRDDVSDAVERGCRNRFIH